MGLMLAEPGFHSCAFVEWEVWPRAVLIAAQRAGYFAPTPIWDDLRSFDARVFRGAFDIVLAGYPCQPFSAAGKRAGADDPRHLWPDVARVIGECRPEWVFLENVPGHIMPHSLGGIRMAIQVAEMARAGLTPDWMPGVVPRCVPLEIKTNQHGERATTIVVGTERVKTRGKWRTVDVLACPVTWRPHPEQIASARRGYEDWSQALDWVRDGLIVGGMLREIQVTAAMPKAQPWQRD